MKPTLSLLLLSLTLTTHLHSIPVRGTPDREDSQVEDGIMNIRGKGRLDLANETVIIGNHTIPLNLDETEKRGYVTGAAISRTNKKFAVVLGYEGLGSTDLIVSGDAGTVGKVRFWEGRNFITHTLGLSESGRYLFAVVGVYRQQAEPNNFSIYYNPVVLDLADLKTHPCDYDGWQEYQPK